MADPTFDLPCGQFQPGFEPTPPPDINPVPDGGVVLPPLPSLTTFPGVEPPTDPTPPILTPRPGVPPPPPPPNPPPPATTPNPVTIPDVQPPPRGPVTKWFCTTENGVRKCRAYTSGQATNKGLVFGSGKDTEAACVLVCVNTPPPTPGTLPGFGTNPGTTTTPVPIPEPSVEISTNSIPSIPTTNAFTPLEERLNLEKYNQDFSVPGNNLGELNKKAENLQRNSTNIYRFSDGKTYTELNGEMVEIPNTLRLDGINIQTEQFLLSKSNGYVAARAKQLYYDLDNVPTNRPVTSSIKNLLSNQYSYLLNSLVDESIVKVLNELETNYFNFDSVSNLTLDKIDISLKNNVKEILKNLKTQVGFNIDYGFICESIKNYILDDSLTSITAESLRALQRGTHKNSRDLALLRNIRPSLIEIVSYILANKRSVDPNKYSNRKNKNFLKNWWVQPLELFEAIPLLSSSGTMYFDIDNNYQAYGLSGGVEVSVSSTEDHTVFLANGVLDTSHNLENSYVLSNFDKELVFLWLNEMDTVSLEVSSPTSGIELTLDNETAATPPQAFYLFQLVPSSITNSITKNIVNNIKASYNKVSTYDNINDFIRRKAAPWKILYIEKNDPITQYFDLEDSTYTFKFKDITLSDVGGQFGTEFIVPTVPSFIVLVTTDKLEHNIYRAESELIEGYLTTEVSSGVFQINLNQPKFNSRTITWGLPVLKANSQIGLATPLKSYYYTFRGVNAQGEIVDTQDINFKFDPENSYFASATNYNSAPLVREESGLRNYYNIVNDLLSNNNIDPSGVMSIDIVSRMPSLQYFKFRRLSNKILSNLNKAVFGVRVVNKNYNQTRTELTSINFSSIYGSN